MVRRSKNMTNLQKVLGSLFAKDFPTTSVRTYYLVLYYTVKIGIIGV